MDAQLTSRTFRGWVRIASEATLASPTHAVPEQALHRSTHAL